MLLLLLAVVVWPPVLEVERSEADEIDMEGDEVVEGKTLRRRFS